MPINSNYRQVKKKRRRKSRYCTVVEITNYSNIITTLSTYIIKATNLPSLMSLMLFRNHNMIDTFLAVLLLLLLAEKWTITAVESRMPTSVSISIPIDESSIIRQSRRRHTGWRSRSWGDYSHRRQQQRQRQRQQTGIEDTDIVMEKILCRYNFRGGDDTTTDNSEEAEPSQGLTTDNTHNTKSVVVVGGKDLVVSGGTATTVVSVGIIDLSGRRQTNQNLSTTFSSSTSSIVLLVDDHNDNNTIDETILQKLILPVLPTEREEEKEVEEEENAGTIVRSLALLCDVLVIQITGNEDENGDVNSPSTTYNLPLHLMDHIIHGNRQRKIAGMAKGKLWIMDTITTSTGKREVHLRRIISNHQDENDEEKEEQIDDNQCYSDNTTWSTLFSSSFGEQQNKIYNIPQIEELFTILSRQVIIRTNNSQQQHSTTFKSKSVPTVLAKYLNIIRDDDRKVQSLVQTTELENDNNDQQTTPTTPVSSSYAEGGRRNDIIENPNQILRRKLQQNNNNAIVEEIMGTARRRLEDLETKMQEIFLVDESSSSSSSPSPSPFNPMPLLEFGSLVKNILDTTETQLREETADSMSDSFRRGIIKGIVVEVQRLYKDQLQALRNYYGQRYEAILDEEFDDEKDDVDEGAVERRWAIAAEHMTTAFQAAAENAAIPVKYRSIVVNDSNDDDVKKNHRRGVSSFDHIDTLQGLIRDMMEATERRKNDQTISSMLMEEEEEDDDEGSTSTTTRKRKRRVPKWLERIAARAFVFGVNYVQGWLAWQGIRRAAIERDRNQPKFPLF
jgi:hypothetical protein